MSRSAANPRFFSRVSEALVKANLALAAEREGNFVAAIGLFRSTIRDRFGCITQRIASCAPLCDVTCDGPVVRSSLADPAQVA